MSNVHQLVNELATYEQQRKQLEADIEELNRHFSEKNAEAFDDNFAPLSAEFIDNYYSRLEELEDTLDNVWLKIDQLNEWIDEESNMSYNYDPV